MKIVSEHKESDPHLTIVGVAERLFSQIGFQKTTVADIARELRMSPANVYRFFAAKSEINEAVGRRLLEEMEGAVAKIAGRPGRAGEKLRASVAAIESANSQRFMSNRKLHELVETAFNENWPIVREHVGTITRSFAEIISQGKKDGEFHVEDCDLAATLVHSACIRFCHPRLMVEWAQEPEPTLDQMVDFCLIALR